VTGLLPRWIDNYAYRLSGGWIHTKEVRFGDEAGCPMNALRNFAPHICVPLESGIPNDGDKLCGLPPSTGALPENVTSGWSSIIIEGGYLCAAGSDRKADIVLDQIPAQLVLKDVISMMGSGQFGRSTVVVSESLDLDGPYMNVSAEARASMRIKISDVWNVGPGDSGLPQQLWPFVEAGEVIADSAPTKGSWLAGQIVQKRFASTGARARMPLDEAMDSAGLTSREGLVRGWICEESGAPGRWSPLE
jgi:hypothetical protein